MILTKLRYQERAVGRKFVEKERHSLKCLYLIQSQNLGWPQGWSDVFSYMPKSVNNWYNNPSFNVRVMRSDHGLLGKTALCRLLIKK